MQRPKTLLLAAALAVGPLAACGTSTEDTAAAETTATTTADTGSTAADASTETADDSTAIADATTAAPGGGSPGGVEVSSVSTVEELVALIQEAYGDAGLGLHRGHQPVEDVLNEVLTISHDELHVRMEEQGQNLAAVATDIGVDPQTLIDALVESWSPAVDNVLATGAITEDEAAQYLAALEEAFTFRVTWDGESATPTFTGI